MFEVQWLSFERPCIKMPPAVATFSIHDDRESACRLIELFECIAAKEGWQPGDQLNINVHRSVYFALEQNECPAGGIQLEIDDGSGFWSFQHVWPDIRPRNDVRIAHIALLALIPEVRGQQRLFWLPCIEMWRYSRAHNIEELWLEATPATLAVYRRIGWPLEIIGDVAIHWGEPCCLCKMGVDEVEKALIRRSAHSTMYRELVNWAHRPYADKTL